MEKTYQFLVYLEPGQAAFWVIERCVGGAKQQELDVNQSVKQFDEPTVSYFIDHYASRADALYRFAFALTLSLDGARQLVEQTFQDVAAQLEQLYAAHLVGSQVMTVLIETCFKNFMTLKNKGFNEGRSAMTQVFKPLSAEERAALAAVDVCGLAATEAAKAFKWDELQLRRFLARSRRGLLASSHRS